MKIFQQQSRAKKKKNRKTEMKRKHVFFCDFFFTNPYERKFANGFDMCV